MNGQDLIDFINSNNWLKTLTIEWVPQGSLVRINEYDGFESVEVYNTDNYFIA